MPFSWDPTNQRRAIINVENSSAYYDSNQIGYSVEPSGEIAVDRLLAQKSDIWFNEVSGRQKKKLVLCDWSIPHCLGSDVHNMQAFLIDLVKNGFEVYIWNHNRLQLIDEALIYRLADYGVIKINPTAPSEIKDNFVREYGVSASEIGILDYHGLRRLLAELGYLDKDDVPDHLIKSSDIVATFNERENRENFEAVIDAVTDKGKKKIDLLIDSYNLNHEQIYLEEGLKAVAIKKDLAIEEHIQHIQAKNLKDKENILAIQAHIIKAITQGDGLKTLLINPDLGLDKDSYDNFWEKLYNALKSRTSQDKFNIEKFSFETYENIALPNLINFLDQCEIQSLGLCYPADHEKLVMQVLKNQAGRLKHAPSFTIEDVAVIQKLNQFGGSLTAINYLRIQAAALSALEEKRLSLTALETLTLKLSEKISILEVLSRCDLAKLRHLKIVGGVFETTVLEDSSVKAALQNLISQIESLELTDITRGEIQQDQCTEFFNQCQALKVLKLKNCDITLLSDSTFPALSMLKINGQYYVSGNQSKHASISLASLQSLLKGTPRLSSLTLEKCVMTSSNSSEYDFPELYNLVDITLNNICALPTFFRDLSLQAKHLRRLKLAEIKNSSDPELEPVQLSLSKLEVLDISGNHDLACLDLIKSLLTATALIELKLSGNLSNQILLAEEMRAISLPRLAYLYVHLYTTNKDIVHPNKKPSDLVWYLLKSAPNLRELTFSSLKLYQMEGVNRLHFPLLKSLTLLYSRMLDTSLVTLLNAAPALETLAFSRTEIVGWGNLINFNPLSCLKSFLRTRQNLALSE